MGTIVNFNSDLVRSYISFLRGEGQKYVPSPLYSKVSGMSTPLLSWIYFNRNNQGDISSLVDFDRKRQFNTVGPYLVEQGPCHREDRKETRYNEALEIIKTVWLEMHSLIISISPMMSYPGSMHVFESASDPKLFGEIIYRMDSDCPVKWAEILVHEIGHHYLYVITSTKKTDEIFNRAFKDTRFSNLKKETRPLIGIYHAVFAQSCMITLASKVLDSGLDHNKKLKAEEILARFWDIFPKDLETITKCDLLDFDAHIKSFIEEARIRFLSHFKLEAIS